MCQGRRGTNQAQRQTQIHRVMLCNCRQLLLQCARVTACRASARSTGLCRSTHPAAPCCFWLSAVASTGVSIPILLSSNCLQRAVALGSSTAHL